MSTAHGERSAPLDTEIHGHCDPAFAPVGDAFAESFAKGKELGAAIAVYAGDRLVVDLWGGVADRHTGRPWLQDTPCLAFSCTKAVTAAAALLLAERGAYDIDGPVATWWPEFAGGGKEGATAAHLLSHQVGLPAFDRPVTPEEAQDPAAMAALLAAQTPLWTPGEDHGYHALTYGWLAGEIVRRLSGRTVGEFVADEIAGPRGLDLWIGASDEVRDRAARLSAGQQSRPTDAGPAEQPAPATSPSDPGARMIAASLDPESLLNRALQRPAATAVKGGYNSPLVMSSGWPAAGMVTTATALAGFYRDLLAGRILQPDTLQEALKPRVSGPDRVMYVDSTFGLGFMRPAITFLMPPKAQAGAFGHPGFGGAIGLGDTEHDIAMAYLPNKLVDEVGGALRRYRYVAAVYDCLD